ncbi:MAG: hypothetical protein ACOX6V_01660 [Patescibacteria group bacterium]|jgi:hypothetical protein
MLQTDFLTLILISLVAGVAIYKISFFSRKSIGYFSLLQIIYLVIIPGFVYTLAYSYLQSILKRPLNSSIILPDSLIINILLLSMLFSYGGIAVHAVTKMLSEVESLRNKHSEAYKINRYFHLNFSHNLIYSGGVVSFICFTLLELNHVVPNNNNNFILAMMKGLILGGSIIMAMYWYTVSKDDYIGRWSDLKTVFLSIWVGFLTILYGVQKVDPSIRDYQLLLPALLSFSLIALLNMFLVFRRFKRGGFALYFNFGRKKKKLVEVSDKIFSSKNNPQPKLD